MEFLIRNRALDAFLQESVEAFYELCPGEAAAFDRYVDETSHQLIKPSGMSRDGFFLTFAKIPETLHAFLRREYRRRFENEDFFKSDPEGEARYYRLFEIWKKARIRRKPTQMLRVPSFKD